MARHGRHKRPAGKERNDMQPWEGYEPVELTPGGRFPFPTASEPVHKEEEEGFTPVRKLKFKWFRKGRKSVRETQKFK